MVGAVARQMDFALERCAPVSVVSREVAREKFRALLVRLENGEVRRG